MLNEVALSSKKGKLYYFNGNKDIENNSGVDVWLDTVALFMTLYDGSVVSKIEIGKGDLKIK